MGRKRQFISEFKAKLVIELLKEERTIGEIAAENQINPNQLARWCKEFLDRAPNIFEDPKAEKLRKKAEREAAEEKGQMLKKIGELTMERDFLQAVQAKQEDNRRFL
jgi:transposase-like protein